MDDITEKVGDPQPDPANGREMETAWEAASSEIVSDAGVPAAGETPPADGRESVRLRRGARKVKLNLPNAGKEPPWWVRHAPLLSALEWTLAAVLILVAVYHIWLLFFAASDVADRDPGLPPPTAAEFRELARALPAVPAENAWRAEALSPRWKRIVVHHSATAQGSAESFDRVHREERKWENGLGYHFVIGNGRGMEDGEVAVGGRWKKQLDGAHVKGSDKQENMNANSIGVALVGNFENTVPTARQLAALKGLVDFLRKECRISIADVVGHAELSEKKTLCPGRYFFIDELRLAIANP